MTYHDGLPARRSILIVEDEGLIAMMLEEFLGALGYHVCGVAVSVEEARQKLEAGVADLAILDCRLNGEDVWPIADMLEMAQIPYIISTGGAAEDVPHAYSARPMLAKPYTMGALASILSDIELSHA